MCAQRRLWSACTSVQADQSLRCPLWVLGYTKNALRKLWSNCAGHIGNIVRNVVPQLTSLTSFVWNVQQKLPKLLLYLYHQLLVVIICTNSETKGNNMYFYHFSTIGKIFNFPVGKIFNFPEETISMKCQNLFSGNNKKLFQIVICWLFITQHTKH